jgi:histidyl-tRNA synthetase
MIDPRVASGLRDLLPTQAVPRERMLRTLRDVFGRFGFLPIETPHIERMEVLTGKGAGSEEVLRQMFDVTNKGGTPGELALRFDLTVPLARFIARHVDQLGTPFKRYAIGSVFRGERPAKGRFREFTQCDFDTVGSESVLSDAETAQVIHDSLAAIGVPGFVIAINNRRVLDGLLETHGIESRKAAVLRSLDKLAKVGRDIVLAELQKDEGDAWAGLSETKAQQVLEFVETGRGGAHLLEQVEKSLGSNPHAAAGLANLRAVLELLDAAGVPEDHVVVDLGLARGLDYYTGVVFETTLTGWERFGSVASGGRYDDLASLFTSRRLPGVGASIGFDRLLALMEEAGWLGGSIATAPVLVTLFPGTEPALPFRVAARLRAAGIGAELYPEAIAIGKQLGYGSSRGHRFGLIIGPDEATRGVFNMRDLRTRQERKGLSLAELEQQVSDALREPAPDTQP